MQKSTNETQKSKSVYILLSKPKRTFFIATGPTETLRETYRHHIHGRRITSKNFINSIVPKRPCLLIIEEIDPKEKANLLLVWLRILRENRFTCFNHPDLIEMSEHLYLDNKIAYEARKSKTISELLACNNCPIPTYNKETCTHFLVLPKNENKSMQPDLTAKQKRKRSKEIRFKVSQEEAAIIESNTKELKMQVTNYVRMVARDPIIRTYNYRAVSDHTKEIGEILTSINRLIFTIDATNNYLPKEIKTIVELMNEIFKSENCLLETIEKLQEHDSEKREPYIKE